jgi:hypothetical protein
MQDNAEKQQAADENRRWVKGKCAKILRKPAGTDGKQLCHLTRCSSARVLLALFPTRQVYASLR